MSGGIKGLRSIKMGEHPVEADLIRRRRGRRTVSVNLPGREYSVRRGTSLLLVFGRSEAV